MNPRELRRRRWRALIQPHFAPLGSSAPGPTLIFLEDTSLMAEKVQQSKLAALGRLSASIAHEIRNPVGAMSHAGQLLAESPNIAPEDRRLTDIIRSNSERVSTIINNVLQLSRRESTEPARLSLGDWLKEFLAEFSETMQVPLVRSECTTTRTSSRCASTRATCTRWCGTCATTPSSTASPGTASRSRSA
jgi:signal transduction histidine kinase